MPGPVMIYRSECWTLNKRGKIKMEVAEMKTISLCGCYMTRLNRIKNEYIKGGLEVAGIVAKIKEKRLRFVRETC